MTVKSSMTSSIPFAKECSSFCDWGFMFYVLFSSASAIRDLPYVKPPTYVENILQMPVGGIQDVLALSYVGR